MHGPVNVTLSVLCPRLYTTQTRYCLSVTRDTWSKLWNTAKRRICVLCMILTKTDNYFPKKFSQLRLLNLLKPTGYVMHQQFNIQQLYALPTMCFVFIWEQTATCATNSINWLVFITEIKSVYSAVRTGSLNKAVCASSLKGYWALKIMASNNSRWKAANQSKDWRIRR
jgi:hypothetical protein